MTHAATAPGKCIRCVETMKGITTLVLVVFTTAVLARPHSLHTKVRSVDSNYCGMVLLNCAVIFSDMWLWQWLSAFVRNVLHI